MFVDAVSRFYFECDFQVMIQPHNRHMSFSVYICVLSVADTVSLIIGRYRICVKHIRVREGGKGLKLCDLCLQCLVA